MSPIYMTLLKDVPADLLDVLYNADGSGTVRFSDEGKIVVNYLT